MAQLAPLQLEDGTMIYIEAEAMIAEPLAIASPSEPLTPEPTRGDGGGAAKGWNSSHQTSNQHTSNQPTASRTAATNRLASLETTIQSYTRSAVQAVQQVATGNINKVTLEFGVKISGEAGIPYITKGTAESNLKVTVECAFAKLNAENLHAENLHAENLNAENLNTEA